MTSPERVVIAGASRAGLTVARTLRQRGFDGRVTLLGAEPCLPYDRTHLSKQALREAVQTKGFALCGAADLADIDLRPDTRAAALDLDSHRVTLDNGEALGFDGLFIATGASPRWPPSLERLAGVHVLRNAADASALRADLASASRVLVVGGGFIGTEVAAVARERGLPATLVEPAPVVLSRTLGDDIAAAWTSMHQDHGVEVRCGTAVVRLCGEAGKVSGAVLDDGSQVAADVAVIGVGATACTDWLEGSGLTIDDGVVCDDRLQAADGVYAAGDVARWPNQATGLVTRVEHWTNAHEQGLRAAGNYLGDNMPFTSVPYVWSDQYGMRLQLYGSTYGADTVHVLDRTSDLPRLAVYGRFGRVTAALGINAAKALLPWRRAIAAGQALDEALDNAGMPATTAG